MLSSQVNKFNAQSAFSGFYYRQIIARCVLSNSKFFRLLKTLALAEGDYLLRSRK